MGVAIYQECPEGKKIKIWIENFEKCSESGKCLNNLCIYN
jgi:hypothetical protein